MGSTRTLYLPFLDHVRQFDAGQTDPSAAGSPEPRHGPRPSLDRLMGLLDQVVEIFDWRICDRTVA
jgi:hypothetical protein